MNEMKMLAPVLKKLGINMDKLKGDKLNKLINMAKKVKNPSDISPEMAKEFSNILNINSIGTTSQPKKSSRIKPNSLCPCGSQKKYKKCCRLKTV